MRKDNIYKNRWHVMRRMNRQILGEDLDDKNHYEATPSKIDYLIATYIKNNI